MGAENPFKYSVRVATLSDSQSITALSGNSYPALMKSCYKEPALSAALSMINQANPALLAAGTYYLAQTQDNLVVGCRGWTRERPGTGNIVPRLGHIRHFATHPKWVVRGIGRGLASTQHSRRDAYGVQKEIKSRAEFPLRDRERPSLVR